MKLRSTLKILALAGLCALGVRQLASGSSEMDHTPIERDYTIARQSPAEAEDTDRRQCEERLRQVLAEPALPGAPKLEQNRAQILARAKAEPLLFAEAPDYTGAEAHITVRGLRKILATGGYPWSSVMRVLETFDGRPKDARGVLLKNGYLYAEDPALAYALVALVQPHHLFGHDRIWVQRGERTYFAERKRGRYYYADGPLEGERVRLLHLDRMGHGDGPSEPLHRDVRSLMYRLSFNRMQVRHITASHIVANLRYGRWWVPTVLATDGARVKVECEIVTKSTLAQVNQAKRDGRRRIQAVQALRQTMLAQIDEALPFDEPRREYGHQLDGKLRKNWRHAYTIRRSFYAFNGDRYETFDEEGRPLVPQVCVDFLTDTFERTSGTWWPKRGELPVRQIGKLDFGSIDDLDRGNLRQIPNFVEFARKQTQWFDVHDATPNERTIRMGFPNRFYSLLEEQADDYIPGDIVMIKGRTPWDRSGRRHYHSFFIYESDPVTGMPLIVVGNAGKPTLRSWETEARRTPRRSIHHRIRAKIDWLESIIADPAAEGPLPLAAGPTE